MTLFCIKMLNLRVSPGAVVVGGLVLPGAVVVGGPVDEQPG